MLRLSLILTLFILVSCESFRPVYVNNTIPDHQIRLSRYSDGCCGCEADVIDVKTSDTTEVRYWLHCNCSFNRSVVSKNVISIQGKKVLGIRKYKSLTIADDQESNIALDHTDSLILFKLSETMVLDYGRNCDSTTHQLKLITGFRMDTESINYKYVKPYFRKKIKI